MARAIVDHATAAERNRPSHEFFVLSISSSCHSGEREDAQACPLIGKLQVGNEVAKCEMPIAETCWQITAIWGQG